VKVNTCEIEVFSYDGFEEFARVFAKNFEGCVVTRSLEQNDCLHKWCRIITDHLLASGIRVTEETVKELVLLKLGNTREIMGEKVAMRSHKYRQIDAELTPSELKAGLISMNELLGKIEAWAATDLNLQLARDDQC